MPKHKPNPRNTNGHRRRQMRDRIKAEGKPCHICHQPIDYTLPANHPHSYVIDEIIPISHGATLTYNNSAPAHRWCNAIKSNKTLAWAQQEIHNILTGKPSQPTHHTTTPFTKLNL